MKIDDQSNLGPTSTAGAKGAAGVEPADRRDVGQSSATGGGKDSAEISGLAGKISQAVSKDSANRAAEVEQLRAQVAGGSFHVDVAATSRGIVNDSLTNAATAGGSSKK
jgi:anti-sigma28 factor (negative regulator of flagellin synthesis)